MRHHLVAGCLLLLAARAAEAAPGDPVRLTLHPAALPSPALRYRLLPELAEQTPGNAAPRYRAAARLLKEASLPVRGDDVREEWERQQKWREVPLHDLPREEVRGHLGRYGAAVRAVEEAARCERCDWELTEQLRKKGLGAALPSSDLQALREFNRLLALRTRLELADRESDRAVATLRTNFSLARDVGAAPSLVHTLVGIALTSVSARAAEEVLQQPGAPNLYWALADAPRALPDLRRALEGERLLWYAAFPGMLESATDLRAGPMRAEQIAPLVDRLVTLERAEELAPQLTQLLTGPFPEALAGALAEATAEDGRWKWLTRRLALAGRLAVKHEAAKRALVARGRPLDRVEAMPQVQAGVLHALLECDRQLDEVVKWLPAPAWQAYPALREAEQESRRRRQAADSPALTLGPPVVGPFRHVLLSRARVERKVASLRVVEAIRLYAASHGAALPPSLEAIKEVPLPLDPLTGKPFEYRAEGEKATLAAPPLPRDLDSPYNWLSYELTLRR